MAKEGLSLIRIRIADANETKLVILFLKGLADFAKHKQNACQLLLGRRCKQADNSRVLCSILLKDERIWRTPSEQELANCTQVHAGACHKAM